jgi:hypothetical protein
MKRNCTKAKDKPLTNEFPDRQVTIPAEIGAGNRWLAVPDLNEDKSIF